MADKNVVEMIPYLTTPAADDVLYVGDISEAVEDDQNKGIEVQALFDYLEQGNWAGDVVLNAANTMNLAVGTIHINEAVDLTATSTELNQLDGVTVGGTSAGDIVDLNTAQSLSAKTLVTPTIASFANAAHDHADAAGGGIVDLSAVGSITSAAGTISMGANTDIEAILGVVKIGYNGSEADQACFGHYDHFSATAFALKATNSGDTILNCVTGRGLYLAINDAVIQTLAPTGISVLPNTDSVSILGRWRVGYDGVTADKAVIGHYDMFGGVNYALMQNSSGLAAVNCAAGQNVELRVANVETVVKVTTGNCLVQGTLQVSPDTDAIAEIGRARIGYDGTNSDFAVFAHYDNFTDGNYAIRQGTGGTTKVNAGTGLSIVLAINDSAIANVAAAGLTIQSGVILARANVDTEHVLGTAKIGYNGTDADNACFAHYDYMSATGFALRQIGSTGVTVLNAPTGATVSFRINDAGIASVSADGLAFNAGGARITQFDDDVTMAAASATRGVTQAAAKGYTDGRTRVVTMEVVASGSAVATGNSQASFVVPAEFNGKNLTDVMCGVYDKGITATTDVMIRRRRAGVDADMLSVVVTIGDEFFASDETINGANDDLATGDTILVDVDAIHSGTAPNGLTVTLEIT